jgi:hypothetical protein
MKYPEEPFSSALIRELASKDPETLDPKSELTLDQEEFLSLIQFLRQSYEPFRQGVKAFIPLDRPFEAENAAQTRALFSLPSTKDLVNFILDNKIIPAELAAGLRQTQRARAVRKLEKMLADNLSEGPWRKWLQQNSWVLGSEFVRVLDERDIDTRHISDFLMEAYDGFLDVVEIKRPEGGLKFWSSALDHGNCVPSLELTKVGVIGAWGMKGSLATATRLRDRLQGRSPAAASTERCPPNRHLDSPRSTRLVFPLFAFIRVHSRSFAFIRVHSRFQPIQPLPVNFA